MKIPVYQIDAFTDEPFSGNAAAVCPLESWLPDHLMQSIAAEMNLSETAFFVPSPEHVGEFDLRWFSPLLEVDLCGHATLASGRVVFDHIDGNLDKITFHTRSGPLTVSRKSNMLELDLPSNPPELVTDENEITAVANALGIEPVEVLHANTTVAVFRDQNQIAVLEPNFGAISNLQQPWLAATALADSYDFDFVSRFFVPSVGIDEDPATGSSHAILAPYWGHRLGKTRLVAKQISDRGGTFYCELAGNRVRVAGHSVEVMCGELDIPQ